MKCDIVPIVAETNKPSNLFNDFLDSGMSRKKAIEVYKHIYSKQFRNMYGDWLNNPDAYTGTLDENGEPVAYELVLNTDNETVEDIGTLPGEVAEKISHMARNIDARVELDAELEQIAKVETDEQGNTTVTINPELVQSDTVFHEYGHIFIDGVGGVNNPMIQRGLQHVADTKLYNETKKKYPELTEEQLLKETLAQAIGKQADEIYNKGYTNQQSAWKRWLDIFLRQVRRVFGIQPDVVTQLSQDLLDGNYRIDSGVETTYYQKAENIDLTPQQRERYKMIEQARNNITRLINELKNNPAQDKDVVEKYEDVRKDLVQSMNRTKAQFKQDAFASEAWLGIQSYLNFVSSQLEIFTEILSQEDMTLDDIDFLYRMSKAYRPEHLESILMELKTNPQLVEQLEDMNIFSTSQVAEQISEITSDLRMIEQIYKSRSKGLLVDKMEPYEHSVRADYRDRFRREFEDGEMKEGYEDMDKSQYVNKRMQEEEAEIRQQSRKKLYNIMTHVEDDIGSIARYMVSAQHTGDDMLAIAMQIFNEINFRVQRDYREVEENIRIAHEKLQEYKGYPGDNTVYEDVLATDSEGNFTGYLVDKYKIDEFLVEDQKNRDRVEELQKKGQFEKADRVRRAWLDENTKKVENEQGNMIREPNNDYLNPRWEYIQDTPELKQYYDTMLDAFKRFDDMRPMNMRMGEDIGIDGYKRYRLPALRESKMERFTEAEGISEKAQSLWVNVKEEFQIQPDDVEFGETKENTNIRYAKEGIDGEIDKHIPVFFTPGSIELSDQSFDLSTIMLHNAMTSINYRHKSEQLPLLRAMEYQMGERSVERATGSMRIIKRLSGEPSTMEGEQTNSYELFKALMDREMYGQKIKKEPLAKAANTIMSVVSLNFLAGNVLASSANLAKGQIDQLMEAAAGRRFNLTQYVRDAHTEYLKYVADMSTIRDIGTNRRTSRVNKILEYFDALNEFRGPEYDFSRNRVWKHMASNNTLHGLNSMAEHFLQGTASIAYLMNVPVVNENGEYINSEGEVVESKDEGMSLYEAMDTTGEDMVVNADHIMFKDEVRAFDETTQNMVQTDMREAMRIMHGAYSSQNMADAQRYILGRMGFMMRKWIIPGIQRRYGYDPINNVVAAFQRGKKGERAPTEYNPESYENEQAYYVTTINFLTRLTRDIVRTIRGLERDSKPLSPMEKENLRKMATEVTAFIVLVAFQGIAQGLIEDSDEDDPMRGMYHFMAYETMRLQTELLFYTNPNEALRIMQHPAATVGLLEDTAELATQMMPWNMTDRYERGRRAGELKLNKDVVELVPFMRHIDNMQNIDELISFFE